MDREGVSPAVYPAGARVLIPVDYLCSRLSDQIFWGGFEIALDPQSQLIVQYGRRRPVRQHRVGVRSEAEPTLLQTTPRIPERAITASLSSSRSVDEEKVQRHPQEQALKCGDK